MAASQKTQNLGTPTQKDVGNRLIQAHLREDIQNTLMKFSFKQLLQEEIINLFEIDLDDLVEKIEQLKLTNSKKTFAFLLSRRIKQAFSVEEMRNIQHSLLLYKTAYNSKQKRWFPINLLEPADQIHSSSDTRIISREVQQAFRIKGLNAIVKVIKHEDLMWVLIIERKLTRKKGIKLKPPVFFCFEVGTPYLFASSGPKVPAEVLECMVKALQYKKHKFHQLDSKHVLSMLSLLKNKDSYKENLSNIEYESGEVEVGPRSIDFSQVKARRHYANKVFNTKDPVLIDSFTTNVDGFWRENGLVPEMEGEPIKIKMTITNKAGSIVDMIKELQTQEVIATPIPKYMQEIITSARNKVRMRVAQAGNPETQ